MINQSPAVTQILTRATAALLTVVDADPRHVEPCVVIECLAAAEHLRAAGADVPTSGRIEPDDNEVSVRGALQLLATLPADIFALDDVLAAAVAARTALEYLQDQ
jgi:hypothetical protein